MADTLTITISPEDAEKLQQLAAETGESVEALASRLIAHLAADADSALTAEQLADARERQNNPGPFATDKEVEAFFSRFRE